LLSEVSAFTPKAVGWKFLCHHWQLLDQLLAKSEEILDEYISQFQMLIKMTALRHPGLLAKPGHEQKRKASQNLQTF